MPFYHLSASSIPRSPAAKLSPKRMTVVCDCAASSQACAAEMLMQHALRWRDVGLQRQPLSIQLRVEFRLLA